MIGSAQEASAFVIDFESFTAGTIMNTQMSAQIPNGPLGLGVTIFVDNFNDGNTRSADVDAVPAQLLANYLNLGLLDPDTDLGVVFDSDNPTGGDGDLAAPFTATQVPSQDPGSGTNPGKFLIIEENPFNRCNPFPIVATSTCVPDDEAGRPNGLFILQFSQPVAILFIDVFDVEVEENNPRDIIMYDENGVLLAQFSLDDILTTGGNNQWRQIDINSIRVQTMIVEWPGSGAIDNIVYDLPVGGAVLSIDSTPLLLEGINTTPYSILGSLTLVGAIAFVALYFTSKKNQ